MTTHLTTSQMEAIEAHVDKYIGDSPIIFHEIVSDALHIDILHVPPSADQPFHTLLTMGMSAIPMTVPEGFDEPDRSELLIILPAHFAVSAEAFEDENNYWPIRGLKDLARLPVNFETFLAYFHTVPNGDPPEPFASRNKFVCWMVVPVACFDEAFPTLTIKTGLLRRGTFTVRFMQIVPLYKEEMECHLEHGPEALLDRLEAANIDLMDLCNPTRQNACAT